MFFACFFLTDQQQPFQGADAYVPTIGPTILCANHPNMLLDPILTAVYSGREDFAFWAKSTLFNGLQGKILSELGAVPVNRVQDMPKQFDEHGKEIHPDNSALFKESVAVLNEGKCLMLFPEGVSYTESRMQPLKTGAARVVQEFQRQYPGKRVPIVPCGLNYIEKDKFRSSVLLDFGAPLYLDESIADAREQAREFTHRVEQALVALTINADDWEELMDIRLAKKIYTGDRALSIDEHVDLQKRFSDYYAAKKQSEQVIALKDSIREYRTNLEALGLKDWQLSQDLADQSKLKAAIFRKAVRSLLLFPFVLIGIIFNFLPVYLTRRANKGAQYVEEKAQSKVLIIAFALPIWYSLLIGISWLLIFDSWVWRLSFGAALLFFGYVELLFMQHERRDVSTIVHLLWLSVLYFKGGQWIAKLRAQRTAIQEQLQARANEYLSQKGSKPLLRPDLPRRQTVGPGGFDGDL